MLLPLRSAAAAAAAAAAAQLTSVGEAERNGAAQRGGGLRGVLQVWQAVNYNVTITAQCQPCRTWRRGGLRRQYRYVLRVPGFREHRALLQQAAPPRGAAAATQLTCSAAAAAAGSSTGMRAGACHAVLPLPTWKLMVWSWPLSQAAGPYFFTSWARGAQPSAANVGGGQGRGAVLMNCAHELQPQCGTVAASWGSPTQAPEPGGIVQVRCE